MFMMLAVASVNETAVSGGGSKANNVKLTIYCRPQKARTRSTAKIL
jgi:hypothetical protein